jgi:hypothetical protein
LWRGCPGRDDRPTGLGNVDSANDDNDDNGKHNGAFADDDTRADDHYHGGGATDPASRDGGEVPIGHDRRYLRT